MTVLRLVVAYLVVPYLIAFALAAWVLGMIPGLRFGRRFAGGALNLAKRLISLPPIKKVRKR